MRANSGHLQPECALERNDAAARDGDLLALDALDAQLHHAARDHFDVLHVLQVHDVATVNAEEAVRGELCLKLGERDDGQVAVRVRVDTE